MQVHASDKPSVLESLDARQAAMHYPGLCVRASGWPSEWESRAVVLVLNENHKGVWWELWSLLPVRAHVQIIQKPQNTSLQVSKSEMKEGNEHANSCTLGGSDTFSSYACSCRNQKKKRLYFSVSLTTEIMSNLKTVPSVAFLIEWKKTNMFLGVMSVSTFGFTVLVSPPSLSKQANGRTDYCQNPSR